MHFALGQVFQRNRTNKIYIDMQKEIYYKGLAHMITKAERPHDLLAIWRLQLRKDSGVVRVQA